MFWPTGRKDTLDYLEAEQNGELSDLDSDDEPEVDTLDLGDDDDYADEEGDEYLNVCRSEARVCYVCKETACGEQRLMLLMCRHKGREGFRDREGRCGSVVSIAAS
jgi:hypothetical protein